MLEIAGGILIAVAVLFALPFILVGAYLAFIYGVIIAAFVGGWFLIAHYLGAGWAWAIMIFAAAILNAYYEGEGIFSEADKNPE